MYSWDVRTRTSQSRSEQPFLHVFTAEKLPKSRLHCKVYVESNGRICVAVFRRVRFQISFRKQYIFYWGFSWLIRPEKFWDIIYNGANISSIGVIFDLLFTNHWKLFNPNPWQHTRVPLCLWSLQNFHLAVCIVFAIWLRRSRTMSLLYMVTMGYWKTIYIDSTYNQCFSSLLPLPPTHFPFFIFLPLI